MRKQLLLLASFFFITTVSFSQKLTLPELINICARQNWETVNTILSTKGWVYHDSKKGDDENYNTITWSYNKNMYTDKAQGWFYLFTYEGLPNKVSYVVLNKAVFSQIQGSLASLGFKRVESEIEDSEIISTYANAAYLVEVSTQRRDEDEWSDASLTAYQITIIKKAGVYDPDNGKKITYDEDGNIEAEYNLKDGKLHGLMTRYEDGVKSTEETYLNGAQTGRYVEYAYDEETGDLNLKVIGSTLDGEKDGKWITYLVNDGKDVAVEYRNFKNGVKHGEVKEFIGPDTVEIANYTDGSLNGLYKRQVKIRLTLPETGEKSFVWADDCEGEYRNGVKSGKWIYSDLLGKLSEGFYVNDLKEGKWIDYTPVGVRSEKIMAEANYVNGQKNGIEKRFFEIDKIEAPAGDKLKFYYKVYPVQEVATYKNDLLNGIYELKDSTGILVNKGYFLNNEKHGRWVEGYSRELPNGEETKLYYEGEYINGKEEGKWIAYFNNSINIETLNFKEGQLHGEYIVWNKYGKPSVTKVFNYGDLVSLTTFDSAGEKPLTKYDIFNETSSSLMCRQTEYFDDKIVSQEYRIFRQENIHHTDFEKVFLSLTGITSSGIYGYKDGEYKVITLKGDLLTKGTFLKEDKVGLWAYYYPEQNVVLEQSYASGQPTDEKYKKFDGQPFSGEFVYHDASAGLKEERKVKDGVRNGKTTYLDSNNKTIKKENYKDGVLK